MSNPSLSLKTEVRSDARARILVVDDEPAILELIATVLGDAGYECVTAADIAGARSHFAECVPDLVLCDVRLPDGSGLDLSREVHASNPDLPVVMVSALDDPRTAATAIQGGAVGYVTKPFRMNDLLIAVLQGLSYRERSLAGGAGTDAGTDRVDEVTGLLDRASTLAALELSLERCRRINLHLGVLVVDVDRFRSVNDSLGYTAGDRLLEAVAGRLGDLVRDGDFVGRWGGNSFLLVCHDVGYESELEQIADRAREALRRPVALAGRAVAVDVSIGTALGRAGKAAAEGLIRDAHIALEQAKRSGRATTRAFDPAMRDHWTVRLTLEAELRGAIDRGELTLHYQPIVDLSSGELAAFEALLRWEHPVHGLVPPGRFVPVAEETGLILDVGRWVIAEACRQLASWAEAPGRAIAVSINISGRQVAEPSFAEDLIDVVDALGVDPRRLGLEITEGVAIESESAQSAISRLQERGFHIILDDFGTGYSVLSSIRRYAIDVLKLDRGFVAGLDHDAEIALVEAILAMGRSLGVVIVAEGIETHGQLAALRSRGCGYGQGYLLARPMPAGEATQLLRTGRHWWALLEEAAAAGARDEPTAPTPPTVASVRRTAPPAHPLPELSGLLDGHAGALLEGACRALYATGGARGWFASAGAREALREWARAIGAAAQEGHYDRARLATSSLMDRAEESGASLLERHGFLECYADQVVCALERRHHSRSTVPAAQRLFRVLGDELLAA